MKKRFNCVQLKRRAQRKISAKLRGKAPREQALLLENLACQSPWWQTLGASRRVLRPSSSA